MHGVRVFRRNDGATATGCHLTPVVRLRHRAMALLAAAGLVLVAPGCAARRGDAVRDAGPPPAGLEIRFFSLGQADSMLIVGPAPERRTLMIDLGEDRWGDRRNYERIARRVEAIVGERRLDQFLISHYHADHMGDVDVKPDGKRPGGLFGLMEDPLVPFRIDRLLDRGDAAEPIGKRTRPHQGLLEAWPRWVESGRLGSREAVRLGTGSIDLGAGVTVEVVAVDGRFEEGKPSVMEALAGANPDLYREAPANENDFSVALILRYGEFELFTGGDLTGAETPADGQAPAAFTVRTFTDEKVTYTNVEGPLAASLEGRGREMDVEVYRADHHGSSHSSVSTLIDRLDPEFSVFSCGGQYGHPIPEVVERLARTSRVLITSGIAKKSWPAGLTVPEARVAGEISILVEPGGRAYTIQEERHSAFTDDEERGAPSSDGAGRDAGAERRDAPP